jgi:hypothetical protein
MNNPVWLYWETQKGKPEPAYITLCRWTMLYQWPKENLIFLNSNNIEHYLPGIKIRVGKIEVDVKGRVDLLKRKVKPNPLNLAVKCDVYRANILNEYGGIYLDSSSIALRSVSHYFSALSDEKSFIVAQRQSHGRAHNPVSFYGCRAKSEIINTYTKMINNLVLNQDHFHYNELGASALTPVVSAHKDSAIILNEKIIMPVTFENAEAIYLSQEIQPKDFLNEDVCLFKLFNGPFKKAALKSLTIQELYYSECFIGKLFRYALPEKQFSHYQNSINQT